MFANSEREGQSTRVVAMSDDELRQGREITTVKSSTIPNKYSGIPCINMVDQVDASLKIHTEPKDIIDTGMVLSKEFSRLITMISSIPTELRLVSCIPHNIMSPCVQPRIDYELQFNKIVPCNILRGITFIYGPYIVYPRIDHLKYTMKICYNEKNLTSSIDVMKITCGTQVTQSFKLKCVEKVSVTKQQNGNGINLYCPKYNFNNNPMNSIIRREVYQVSTNDKTTMTDF